MQKTLTDLTLRSLPEGEYWDTKLPSFGVRIGRRSTTFLLKKNGRRVKLGRYPSVSLQDARKRVFTLKADTTTQVADIAFREAADLFLTTHCKGYRPRPLYEIGRLLKKLEVLDKRKLAKITTHDLNEIIDALTTSEANHTFKAARTFFRWCIRRRFIQYSPLQGLPIPNREASRARVLTDAELKLIWEACEQTGEIGFGTPARERIQAATETSAGKKAHGPNADFPRLPTHFATITNNHDHHENHRNGRHGLILPAHFATIVRLLILTGQRRGEIGALQSSWIISTTNSIATSTSPMPSGLTRTMNSELQQWVVTLPATVTKNGREHSFPLSSLTVQLLKPLIPTNGSALFFPARGATTKPFNGWSKSKSMLDETIGVKDWTLHDLRRTYATNMARLGVPLQVIEKLLNHVSGSFGGIVGVYQKHRYWDEQVEAVTKYESWLRGVLDLK